MRCAGAHPPPPLNRSSKAARAGSRHNSSFPSGWFFLQECLGQGGHPRDHAVVSKACACDLPPYLLQECQETHSREGAPRSNLCCCQHGASCPRVAKGLCLVHLLRDDVAVVHSYVHILGRESLLMIKQLLPPNLRVLFASSSSSPWWLPCLMGFSRRPLVPEIYKPLVHLPWQPVFIDLDSG